MHGQYLMGRTAVRGAILSLVAGLVTLAGGFAVAVQCLPFRISLPPDPWSWYSTDPAHGLIGYLAFPVNLLTNDLSEAILLAPLSLLMYALLGALASKALSALSGTSDPC